MQHMQLLSDIVEKLKSVDGLKAVVLGGSYASGTERPDSDIDIGLYYEEAQPLAIEQVRTIAERLNDTPKPTVTGLGGWGTWVNGGAWLTIGGQRVDFLYRSIDFVAKTLDECNQGIIRSDYWQQPAYGFHSFMYCTETAICKPVYDPEQVIAKQKAKVNGYAPALKQTITKNFLWSTRFTLDNTHKAARRGEVYMVTGALARAIHCLVQVLYALNEVYYTNEKRLATDLDTFKVIPENFLERIYAILGATGTSSSQLEVSCKLVEELYQEIATLANA